METDDGITPTSLRGHITDLENRIDKNIGLFKVQSANEWIDGAKNRPIPKMLFSEFWFEGELCILFAATGIGKSILAVQIGDSISKGEAIPGFKSETGAQKVLYFDFELSDKQFENRYSKDYKEHYNFNPNFIRAEISTDAVLPEDISYENYLNNSFEGAIVKTGARVLIIDNLTYLKNETEKAKDALPLMKHLKALKIKHDISILVLAHTPKRDNTRPISINDIQGSSMIANFMDSCLAIGFSHTDKNLRYLKQIKQRNTEHIFDANNVCVCQMIRAHNFVQFDFIGYGTEGEHLKQLTEKDRASVIERTKELSQQGYSQRQIASELNISVGAVNKYLRK